MTLINTNKLISSELVFGKHDHKICIQQAISNAHYICEKNKYQFTRLRQTIFEIIWQDHQPISAYSIIYTLSEKLEKQIAPPTVYRVLDFFVTCGLIHKITSHNTFIGCSHSCPTSFGERKTCVIFICQHCGNVLELPSRTINGAVKMVAKTNQFTVLSGYMEFFGACVYCKEKVIQKGE